MEAPVQKEDSQTFVMRIVAKYMTPELLKALENPESRKWFEDQIWTTCLRVERIPVQLPTSRSQRRW